MIGVDGGIMDCFFFYHHMKEIGDLAIDTTWLGRDLMWPIRNIFVVFTLVLLN